MKIIKHGKIPKINILRFDCYSCGCVFEVSDKECKAIPEECIPDGKIITHYEVRCPECECWLYALSEHNEAENNPMPDCYCGYVEELEQ